MKKLVYVVSGGISQYVEKRLAATPHLLVREAYEYALDSLGIPFSRAPGLIDGVVVSPITPSCKPHMAAMIMESLGLFSKSLIRIEEHDTTGGACFQEAVRQIISDHTNIDICLAYGWEAITAGSTDKRTDFFGRFAHTCDNMNIAPSHKTTNATPEQTAKVSVKNHRNAAYNPYACRRGMIYICDGREVTAENLTIDDVLRARSLITGSLTRLDMCEISEGAAACILANENGLLRLRKAGAKLRHSVMVSGMGQANGMPSSAHKPPHEYKNCSAPLAAQTVYSSHPTQVATHQAYAAAKVTYPFWELDFVELHDSYAPSEIQTYEDLGLCSNGEGGTFVDNGFPFLSSVNYGRALKEFIKRRVLAVNPSGGLIACGHSGSATALRQIVFSLWQLQETIKEHFGSDALQVPHARRGAIHSYCDASNRATVNILER